MPGPVLAIASSAAVAARRSAIVTRPVRLVVLDGVVGEVQQQLAQTVAVAADGQLLAGGQADLDVRALGEALGVGHGVAHEFVQPHRLERERDLAGIRLGEQREAVHDLAEALDFIQLAVQPLALRVREGLLAPGGLQLAVHDRERRLEFVRGVERELADALERLVQARGHGVEDLGQPVQLVAVAGAGQALAAGCARWSAPPPR